MSAHDIAFFAAAINAVSVCSFTGTQIRMSVLEGIQTKPLECDGLPSLCYSVDRSCKIHCNKATAGRRTPKLLLLGIKVPGLRFGSQVSSRTFGHAGHRWH